jgi:hypothetical protein
MTPTLSSNQKMQGIEHEHFEKKGKKSNPRTFWARPAQAVMKRGLDWCNSSLFFIAVVHAD